MKEATDFIPVYKLCKNCGVDILQERYHTGKQWSLRNVTQCENCRKKHRALRARNNADYEKFRKHYYRTCSFCGSKFCVKGKSNAGQLKACSEECVKALLRANGKATIAKFGGKLPNTEDWHLKIFNRPRSGEKCCIGHTHTRTLKGVLVSPSNEKYEFHNLKEFVRNNEHLFEEESVCWSPYKKNSKVVKAGFAPSSALGSMSCKAYRGLVSVLLGRRGSWKGWRAVRVNETTTPD